MEAKVVDSGIIDAAGFTREYWTLEVVQPDWNFTYWFGFDKETGVLIYLKQFHELGESNWTLASTNIFEIPLQEITVSTDKASYLADEIVTISGIAEANAWIAINVKNPLATIIYVDYVAADGLGFYSTMFRLLLDAMTGTYTVYVDAAGETDSTTFLVTDVAVDTGTLSITTTPVSGTVVVNGVSWGIAPQSQVVAVGSYTVSFGAVSGYTTPVSQVVVVTKDTITMITGTYVEILFPDITVSTDKTSYLADEIVTTSGTADSGALVAIDVKNPLATSIFVDTVTATAGVYSTAFRLPVDAMTGTYTVNVSITGAEASTTFTVAIPIEPIISVSTDKPSYSPDELVTISGTADADAWVAINVVNPLAINIYIDTLAADGLGYYSTMFRLTVDAILGTYTVYVSATGSTASTTFIVEETGILSISTTPITGEVFVDGVSWGDAPVSWEVDVGTYTVTFGDVEGYVTPISQEVVITADITTIVTGTYVLIPVLPAEISNAETLDSTGAPKTSFALGETVLASAEVSNVGVESQMMLIVVQLTDPDYRVLAPSYLSVILLPGQSLTPSIGFLLPLTGYSTGTWTAKIMVLDTWPVLGGVPIGSPVTITFTVS